MCLAVPACVIEVDADSQTALADLHGNRIHISIALVPRAQPGDWVLVHAGFAIQVLDGDDAADTFALLEDAVREGGVR